MACILSSAPVSAPEREVCVLRELRSVSAREGDSATFECTVSETEVTGRWALGGHALRPGGRVRIRQEGLTAFLPSVTPYYLAQGSDRLRPIRISSSSSSIRPRPSAPLPGSPGLKADACSETCLAPFCFLSPIPSTDTSEPPRDLLGCHPHSRILPGSS